MKKLYNLFIIILLSYSGSDLFALDEPFIRLSDVPSQNPLSLSNKNWDSTLNATYHAPNNEIYVLFDNHIYKFDFEQRLWSEYATVDLPHDVVKFAFSEFHNGFLFWDNGVGRVFYWIHQNNSLASTTLLNIVINSIMVHGLIKELEVYSIWWLWPLCDKIYHYKI